METREFYPLKSRLADWLYDLVLSSPEDNPKFTCQDIAADLNEYKESVARELRYLMEAKVVYINTLDRLAGTRQFIEHGGRKKSLARLQKYSNDIKKRKKSETFKVRVMLDALHKRVQETSSDTQEIQQ